MTRIQCTTLMHRSDINTRALLSCVRATRARARARALCGGGRRARRGYFEDLMRARRLSLASWWNSRLRMRASSSRRRAASSALTACAARAFSADPLPFASAWWCEGWCRDRVRYSPSSLLQACERMDAGRTPCQSGRAAAGAAGMRPPRPGITCALVGRCK